MSDTLTIVAREPSTPTGGRSRRSHFTLPPQQLAKARSRLTFLTLVFSGLCVVAIGIDTTFSEFYPYRVTPVYVFNLITSTMLFGATRFKALSDRAVLNLGLVYEMLMCLSVSMGFTWAQYQLTGTVPAVTWVCIVMVIYPLIIPTPPMKTLATALGAAAMVPLGLFLLESFDLAAPRPFDYLDVSFSPFLCVALAVMGSRVIYGLNIDIARAQQMGSYQLQERLGHGGMGEVWRAKHRMLARPAAVKLVRPEIQKTAQPGESSRLLERFRREAQVTAGLESPHTVSLYDFGATDEGVFYYVMELLTGLDLETLVTRYGPVPAERAAHILSQACLSLGEAHDLGLVHRDIKPANLMLCGRRATEYDFVKVLDFGLVALRPEVDPAATRLTAEHQVGGTPAYVSPEAVTEKRVDGRADIYALGCVGYWLLTGETVFEANTAMKMALAHVREEPVPPSERTEVEIPEGLDRLIMACLDKDPGRRPQTAHDLARRLHTDGLAAEWTQKRARAWWEAHRPNDTPRSAEQYAGGVR